MWYEQYVLMLHAVLDDSRGREAGDQLCRHLEAAPAAISSCQGGAFHDPRGHIQAAQLPVPLLSDVCFPYTAPRQLIMVCTEFFSSIVAVEK
jgi:hypothetical protein